MQNPPHSSASAIAIIGMAGRFPDAPDVERFWKNLTAGRESITFWSAEELQAVGVEPELLADPSFVRARSVLADVELFDAALFGLTPREAEVIDPQQRLLLECAWEALERAGHAPGSFPGPIGVFAGAGINTYLLSNLQHNREVMRAVGSFQAMLGSGGDFLSTRISYKLGLKGPSLTVQTACSTSLVAVHLAVQSLLNGECDMALAGGVRLLVPRKGGHSYQPGSIFSQDGHCRPFDAAASGTTDGEGMGLVVLRRLADAVADGDHVHAVILGTAINNDGAAKLGYTVPSVEGQSEVIALAQALAGVEAGTIGLIEAHGTGTPLGDPIEVAALSQVFSPSARPGRRIALGSLKSNLGHLDAAAGVASLIKAALAVERGVILPSLHFERPNPQLDLAAGGFYVPVEAAPWVEAAGPRRAGVSSFGIGGTNAHLVLEEAPAVEPGSASRPLQLLVLSARTPAALEQASRNLAEHLGRHPDLDLADVSYTLQVGRGGLDARRMVVCESVADAAQVLSTLDPKRVLTRLREAGERPVFFLFSGQGAQYPGMGIELYRSEAAFRDEVDHCAEILLPRLGFDLRQALYPALYPEDGDPREAAERLEQTALAQPALFVVEYALARLWVSWGVRPEAMLGHSIGEYVAACLSGVFSLEDALGLVAERGRLMQEMPAGSMLAVPLPEEELRPLLGSLSLAAVNGPAMCVVAGDSGEVAALAQQLEARGLQVRRLHTSHAFHSASMEPVLPRFAAAFAGLRLNTPAIPFVSNLSGTWIRPEEATSPEYWVRHLRETVRFAAGLSTLFGRAGAVFLEVGPGRALTSLVRQHPQRPEAPSVLDSLPTAGDGRTADGAVLRTLGQLWLAGVEIDWAGFHAGERRLRVSLPTYPFERQRFWVEPDAPHAITERLRRRAVGGEGGIADWFWAPLWRQVLPVESDLPVEAEEGSWLVFADETGFGDRLAARLRERGRQVVVAHPGEELLGTDQGDFVLRPGEAADYGTLLDRLARRGIVPARIVHLWSVGPVGPAADSGRELERGFYSLFHLARALGERRPAESRPPLHLGIVSTGVQRITGAEDLAPARATLLGPATTIPQEYPGITCAAIDVTLPPPGSRGERRLIDRLLAELSHPPGESAEPVVAYRGTDRWLRDFEPLSLPSPLPGTPLSLRDGGTYLITGGLGGVGLELAAFLARLARVRLVLAGRRPFPEREAWSVLARGEGRTARIARRLGELEAAGAEVATVSADVTDAASLARMLAVVRQRFGRIDGVIHAAGLPGGGLMQFRSLGETAAVLAPKVEGTLLLADLLAADPPDFLVLCSSLNGLVGGPGQVDYAAASAFLDAFAQAHSDELPVLSIDWDAWRDVGMADRRPESAERPAEVGALTPFPHPLLSERGTDGEGAGVFVGRLSPGATWVLDEHRLGGHPVVPGTAYLEMAGAAFRGLSGTAGAIELRDVQFVTPLHVGDGETRELQIVLRKNGDGSHHFSARSRDGEGWQEHVIGAVGEASGGEERFQLDISSLSSLAGWEEEVLGEDYREDLKQAGLGPRWEVLKKIYRRGGELVGLLELAPEFAGDVQSFQLHPALLDAATSFAEYHVPGARGNYYLPLSYKRLRMLGPLPSRIYSHARLSAGDLQGAETLAFDVAMLDESGVERVRVEEFTLKRVDVAATLRGRAERPARPIAASVLPLAETLASMPAEQAVEAFGRILGGYQTDHVPAQIAVSVRPLPEVLAAARSVTAESLAESVRLGGGHVRPDLTTPYVAPRGELEARLSALWGEVLGLDRVGVFDDFFALGGHSLLGTRVMSRVREAFGVEVPLGKLFEAPTVADFAAVVESLLARAGSAAPAQRDAIPRRPSGGELALSFAQERLWFLEQLEPGNSAYNLPGAVHLEGALDIPALTRSLLDVARRQASLRTTFAVVGERPVQVIAAEPRLKLPRVDLGGLPAGRLAEEALHLAVQEPALPFDLTRGPLFRSALLRLSPRHHVLLFTLHHAIADGWSLGVLVREVAALYPAFVQGLPSPLPELPIQYADYARWQREQLQGTVLREQIGYWRERLAGAPMVLDLPTDRPRPAKQTFRGASFVSQFPVGVVADLERLGRGRGSTLFMVLLAAFETLLHRVTGQDCLLVGSTIANRTHGEIENLIGFFVNALVMRADFPAGMTLAELLAQTRESALGAYAHPDLPFEKLVEELAPSRDPSRSPIFQVFLQLQDAPLTRLALPGLAISPMETPGQAARLDLGLSLEEAPDGLRGIWEFNTDLFDAATVERLAGWLDRLLLEIGGRAESPETRVADLPLLSAAERRQLLVDWSGVAVLPGPGRCLYDLVAEQAALRAEAVAVVSSGESLSYGELGRRATRLARRLRGLGVGPEVRVGLFYEPSTERLIGLLGVLRAGGAYVPLDPEHPAERLAWIADSSGMALALAEERLRARLESAAGALPVLSLAELAQDPPLPAVGEEPPAASALPENLAYIIYTSGSTGRPNGVLVPQRGAVELIATAREHFGIGPESRVAQLGSITFDLSVLETFLALGTGATLVLARSEERLGEDFSALLVREAVTMLSTTPALLATLPPEGLALAAATVGGDRCPAALAQEWSTRLALYNCYGPTETSIFSVFDRCLEAEEGEPAIGRPVAGTEVYLLDRDLQLAPPGSAGVSLMRRSIGGMSASLFVFTEYTSSPSHRIGRTFSTPVSAPLMSIPRLGLRTTKAKSSFPQFARVK